MVLVKKLNVERKQDKVMVVVLNLAHELVQKDLKRKQEDKVKNEWIRRICRAESGHSNDT